MVEQITLRTWTQVFSTSRIIGPKYLKVLYEYIATMSRSGFDICNSRPQDWICCVQPSFQLESISGFFCKIISDTASASTLWGTDHNIAESNSVFRPWHTSANTDQ